MRSNALLGQHPKLRTQSRIAQCTMNLLKVSCARDPLQQSFYARSGDSYRPADHMLSSLDAALAEVAVYGASADAQLCGSFFAAEPIRIEDGRYLSHWVSQTLFLGSMHDRTAIITFDGLEFRF